MVDITAKLFWYRTKEWYENMADKLNDIVYTDDSKETVNVINLLLLGWILLGLIVYIIGTIIATQLRKRKTAYEASKSEPKDEKPDTTEHVSCAPEVKSTVENEVFSEPEVIQKPFIIPSCTGENPEGVEWINNVFKWIYVHRVVSPIIESWLSALNARTRLASTEHGILVDFKDVKSTDLPTITNVIQAGSSVEEMTVFCQTEIEDVIFEIVVTQFKEKDKNIIPFTLNVKRLSGKMNVECCPEDLTFIARYSEAPQVELSTETVNNSIAAQEDYQVLCNLVCEITTEALLSSIINLRFTCFPECPRLSLKPSASDKVYEADENESGEQLLVKIIKATNIGGDKGCLKPYCVVEMDEPPQKYETRDVEEKSNPFWDESFMFTVKDVSAELLFEVYDKDKSSNENFLGLGIVSVEELIKNPSQRQIIPLQSRPMEKDDVTGSLTTEFLFLNQITPVSEPTYLAQHNGIGDGVHGPGKTVETNSRVTAGGTVITTTTIKRTNQDNEADLTGTALKELEKHKPNASKSTLIIHSVQRVAMDKCGQWQEVQEPDSSVSESLEASPASRVSKDSRTSYSESVPSSPSQGQNGDDRSRSKEKKTFIGSLKRKLSFRKPRSKSAENRSESAESNYSHGSSRSASTDRFKHLPGQKLSPFKGKFIGQKHLAVPGSTRSSLSEASGISASSSRTYINENSTLVVETNENGIIKRYLIPNSLINRSKWKKKGVKLHIFNDHVFVAKHLSGSTTCKVCQKYLTRRPGKQGYECRGCNLQCHKSCHVKVTTYCSNSSVNSMEVEYIHDPRGAIPKSI